MEPPLPPAGDPDPEDQPTLVREPLGAFTTRRVIERRPLWRALSLALTAILVVVAAGVLLQRLRQPPAASGTLPPLTAPTVAPTIPAGQGWTPTGPPWAQSIVFAPSDPRMAYVCGTPTNTDPTRQGPVSLGLSLDSGRTWQSWATSIRASVCFVDVDPTNMHDLLLEIGEIGQCATCSTPGPTQLYRSLDGGQSWHLAALPPPSPGSSSDTSVGVFWAWQGSTLFVSSSTAATPPQSLVAVSVAAGPFVWVNQKALLAGVPAGSQLSDLYATTVAVYADFFVGSSCLTGCFLTKMSADRGATWSIFQPHYQGNTVNLVDQGVSVADGYTLLGEVVLGPNANTGIYVTSTDGGSTWKPIASPPGDLLIMGLASTPSGLFYAEIRSPNGSATALQGVYRLAPGASTWALVGALPANSGGPIAVSWDEQGHPLALWSIAQTSPTQTITAVVLTGLITHAP